MNPDFGEARFLFGMIATLVATVGLFTKFLTGGEFVALQTTILTLYTAHSVVDDKFRDRKEDAHADAGPAR